MIRNQRAYETIVLAEGTGILEKLVVAQANDTKEHRIKPRVIAERLSETYGIEITSSDLNDYTMKKHGCKFISFVADEMIARYLERQS